MPASSAAFGASGIARAIVRAIGRGASAEPERRILWLPVALGAGVGIYFSLGNEPSLSRALFCAAIALASAVAATRTRHAGLSFALALLAAGTLGFAVAKFRTETVRAPVLMHRLGPVAVDGCVLGVQSKGSGQRIVLRARSIDRLTLAQMPTRVRLTLRKPDARLQPGACVHLHAVLMPPPAPAEPGSYDFGRAAFYEGIGAVGYAFGGPRGAVTPPEKDMAWTFSSAVGALRYRISARVHAVLPGSTGAIASTLITGDRGGISEADEAALRDAGLAHVLAIAGLHMALVGLGLFWVVRALLALFPAIALKYPIKKWAACAALAAAAFYLLISGAGVPAMRAFVMLTMFLGAIIADRPALSMRGLAFAAAIILLFWPESLIAPGFQMSFAAVSSLIAVAEWEHGQPREKDYAPWPWLIGPRRYLRGIAMTSFIGSLATAPFAIFHFDRATHYAVLGNLLAMPIMGFVVMPMAALSLLLMPFGLDAVPLHAMAWGIEAMLAIGRWVSHLPGAVSVMAAWPAHALAILSLGGLWLAIWRTDWRWFGLLPMAAGIALAFTARPPDILIARDAATIAIRGRDGELRLLRDGDVYSANEWLKRDGDARLAPDAIATAAQGVRCDDEGCIAQLADGGLLAAITRAEAFAEDCRHARIVIAAVPARHYCHGPPLIIDRFDVAKQEGYALWLGPTIRMRTVSAFRGRRPWSMPVPKRPWRHHINSGG